MGIRTMVKLYCNNGYYATIFLDEIKNMDQNGSSWYIEMKDGKTYTNAQHCVITNDPNELIGYIL